MSPNKLTIVKKVTQEVCAVIGAIFIDKITMYTVTIAPGNTFGTVTIPAVNMAKTRLNGTWPLTTNDAVLDIPYYIELSDSTTIKAVRVTAVGASYAKMFVVEYLHGIKSIQRLIVEITTGTSKNTTINAVDQAKTIVTPLGCTTNISYGRSVSIQQELTSDTNLLTARAYGGVLNSKSSVEIVEFN